MHRVCTAVFDHDLAESAFAVEDQARILPHRRADDVVVDQAIQRVAPPLRARVIDAKDQAWKARPVTTPDGLASAWCRAWLIPSWKACPK